MSTLDVSISLTEEMICEEGFLLDIGNTNSSGITRKTHATFWYCQGIREKSRDHFDNILLYDVCC